MKNLPRYRIPVGWGEASLRHPYMPADTLVIPLTGDPVSGYEVERVNGSWSPHIPEKVPTYEVTAANFESYSNREGTERIEAVRLALLKVGQSFIVERPAKGKQVCYLDGGILHGVLVSMSRSGAYTFCEKHVRSNYGEDVHAPWVRETEPTCPQCLAFDTAWVTYTVFPYERGDREAEDREAEAEARKLRKHMRRPTVYARILDDDFLTDKPTYKPTKPEGPPLPEVDPFEEYEIDPREGKLSTARERSQRMKTAKREARGY